MEILGTTCSSLPILYLLVILKHLKNNSTEKNGFVTVQQINFLLLQPKILLQQPNVLLIELNILLL